MNCPTSFCYLPAYHQGACHPCGRYQFDAQVIGREELRKWAGQIFFQLGALDRHVRVRHGAERERLEAA